MEGYCEHFERIIALEAAGGVPERVQITVPSIVEPTEHFKAHIALYDENGYPSLEADGQVQLRLDGAEGIVGRAELESGHPALASLEGLTVPGEGTWRFSAEFDGKTWFSNSVVCRQTPHRRLYWGDPHVHTIISDCHPDMCRSLDFGYLCARYVTALDWVCIADHVSNGRTSAGKWKAQQIASAVYDDAPDFTNLLAYEASLQGGCGGDNNVYFRAPRATYVDEYEDGNTRTLVEKLGDQEFFAVPHHTTRAGKHGEISPEIYPGPDALPNVEIYSKWGASEYRGNPEPLQKVHEGPAYVQDMLAQGLRLGFMGGTDTHATMSGGYGEEPSHIGIPPGLTGVWARHLSRESLYDALKSRSCYATSAERIICEAGVNGVPGGGQINTPDLTEPRRIRVNAAAPGQISRISIVRNGEDIHTVRPEGWYAEFEYTDEARISDVAFDPTASCSEPFVYYYVRVSCASGARAWTSPVWLSAGGSSG